MLPRLEIPKLDPEMVFQSFSEVYDWGLRDLNIPEIHKQTLGENIKVAVIDSGKSNHFETIENTIGAKNFSKEDSVDDKNGHSCLHPDDFVWTTRNGLESIKEFYQNTNKHEINFELGSYSKYTGDMNIKCLAYDVETDSFVEDKIMYVHKIPVQDEILCIGFGNGRTVRLTKDHPTYTSIEGKVQKTEAQKLQVSSNLLCNNQLQTLSTEYQTIEYGLYRECQSCGHKITMIKHHSGQRQCKKCNKRDIVDKPYSKVIDESWAYIVGIILTDGHLHYEGHNKFIQICNTDNAILEGAEKILNQKGYRTKIYPDARNNAKTLTVCSVELCDFLIAVGIKSGNKTRIQNLPKYIQIASKEVVLAFLAGVIDGDGSVSENSRVRISTGSLEFARQLTYFLMSIGYKARYKQTWNKSKKYINGRECCFDDAWQVTLENPHQLSQYLYSSKKNKLINYGIKLRNTVKVSSIIKESFDGYFYDFTTEKHHNYQGNGVIISNTFVSGLIAARKNNEGVIGVAPEAKLLFGKAMDNAGTGDPSSLANAVNWAVGQRVDIISISAGMFFDFKPLKRAIQRAYRNNITICAAVGNSGTRNYDVAFPARYKEVIGVAAYDSRHRTARFSSRGVNVSYAMPGVDIYSCWLDNQFCKMSGTSFSAPVMSGICALILAKHRKLPSKTPCTTPRQMMQHLQKYSKKIGSQKDSGFGTIDLEDLFDSD